MTLGNVDLTRELVQAVRDAADVVDVAGEHTRLQRKGRDYEGLCPLHKEKTPSFHVDPDKGLFYCFGCGAGGDAIKLHQLMTGDDFPAAIESLAVRYGIPVQRRSRKRGPDEPDVEAALAAAADWFSDQLRRSPGPRRYLEERQVPPELVERYALGYAPDDWTALHQAVSGRVPDRDLEAAGLIARSKKTGNFYVRFRHRLMFPIHNPSGRLVGFGGRTLGDDKAKYINSAETERFHKGELLYGLFQGRRAIRDAGRALLVEGYFDVLGAVAAGVDGAVATMGTALTPEQARLLARYAEEVVVGYDGDNAGEKAHRRALPLLLEHGLAVQRARFPDGHDPDSLRLEVGPKAVVEAVHGAADSVIEEIARIAPPGARREPRLQAKAASDLGELLGRIPDAVLRFTYGRRAAEALDLPVELVLKKVPGAGGGGGGERGGRSAGNRGAGSRGASPGGGGGFPPPQTPPPFPDGPGTGFDAGPGAVGPTSPNAAGGRGDGRGGVGNPPPPLGVPGTVRPPSLVRSLEEQTLQILLVGGLAPPLQELPPPEAFFDAECRNIYRAFCALYRESGGTRAPDEKRMMAVLGEQGGAEARLARILMDRLGEGGLDGRETGPAAARPTPAHPMPVLQQCLGQLQRRWWQQRLRELLREIAEAQREGDGARLDRLLKEKIELSHRLHRGP